MFLFTDFLLLEDVGAKLGLNRVGTVYSGRRWPAEGIPGLVVFLYRLFPRWRVLAARLLAVCAGHDGPLFRRRAPQECSNDLQIECHLTFAYQPFANCFTSNVSMKQHICCRNLHGATYLLCINSYFTARIHELCALSNSEMTKENVD